MNCPNCGSLVEAESRFCIECGSKLVENERDNKGDNTLGNGVENVSNLGIDRNYKETQLEVLTRVVVRDNNIVSLEQGCFNKTAEYGVKDREDSTNNFKQRGNKYVIKKLAEHRRNIRSRMLMYAGIVFFVIVACIGYGVFDNDAPQSPQELKTQLIAMEQREATNVSNLVKSANYININLDDPAAMEGILPELEGYQKDIENTNKQLVKLDKHKDLDPTLAKRIELVNQLGELDKVCVAALINGVEAKLKQGDYKAAFLPGTKAAYKRDEVLAQLAQFR